MTGKGLALSKKQLRVLTWWQDPRWEAVICDGAVRSGKTFAMGLGFFLWAQRQFHGRQFGLCGKTIVSLRRNLLAELTPYLKRLGMDVRERRGENLLIVRYHGHEKFSRSKNNARSRAAIRSQVLVELEKKRAAEIIDGYDGVTVSASQEDPTVCLVEFGFSVAHGLNQVRLTVHIEI